MRVKLKHFKDIEFGGFVESMSITTLLKLDSLRKNWGFPIQVSPAVGSTARWSGEDDNSRHNVDKWGKSYAIDVMPSGIYSKDDVTNFIKVAKRCGFDGIGFYPHWNPKAGFHIDEREDEARWGGVLDKKGNQIYVSLQEAIKRFI
jgi:hypothetical protein